MFVTEVEKHPGHNVSSITRRAIVLTVFIMLALLEATSAWAQTGLVSNAWTFGPYGAHSFKIATLPPSSGGTGDHLHLIATLNATNCSYCNTFIDAVFGNRNGFMGNYTQHGAGTLGTVRLTAYSNTDGSVDIYIMFASAYVIGQYTILENIQETVYPSPTDTNGATPSGTLLFDTSNPSYPPAVYWDWAGDFFPHGNVGIGTYSPSAMLSFGSGTIGKQVVNFYDYGAGSGYNYGVGIQGGEMQFYLWSGGHYSFNGGGGINASGTNELLRIQGNGNVGIGTTTPGARLEVNGSLKLSSGSAAALTFPDGSSQTTAYTGSATTLSSNVVSSSLTSVGTVTSGTWRATPIASAYLPANVDYTDQAQTISGPKTFTSQTAFRSSAGGLVVSEANLDPSPNAHYSLAGLQNTAQLLLGWNYSAGGGEQDLIANRGGGGVGGFSFYDYSNAGVLTSLADVNTAGMTLRGNLALPGSGASIKFPDNSVQSTAWNGILSGGDYAESVDVTGDRMDYEPGDVLVIDPAAEGRFLKSSHAYSTAVMGIYSTKPGLVGRRQKTDRSKAEHEVPMAMIGIVPTKVIAETGPIQPGDLLVTSSLPGYAMKGTDRSLLTGAIIGKALGHLAAGTGIIEIAVSLQ